MPSRVSATPARSTTASSAARRTQATPRPNQAFSPQSQETPLNDAAFLALNNNKKIDGGSNTANLEETLARAARLLTEVVEDINDRAAEDRSRRRNRVERLYAKGEEEDEEQKQKSEAFQSRVADLNKQVDSGMRRVVDDKVWAEGVPDSLKHVIEKSQVVSARAHQRENMVDENGNEVEEEETAPAHLEAGENSTALLQAAQSTVVTEWQAKTLTERYSRHDTYKEFYKMRWDVQHPEDKPPPLPHPSLWFAAEEGGSSGRGGASQRSKRAPSSDVEEMSGIQDDTEIQLQSENVSCRCPLTMSWFQDPVTSTKCPHSFEKSAILEFLHSQPTRIPPPAEDLAEIEQQYPRSAKGRADAEQRLRAQQPQYADCPVCKMQLTEKDLKEDPVLLRKTKRAVEAKRIEDEEEDAEEDEESEDDLMRGSQRRKGPKKQVVNVNSSPATERRRTLVKPERAVSVVPNSQGPGQTWSFGSQGRTRRRVEDLEEDDATDEDEDEDEDENMED